MRIVVQPPQDSHGFDGYELRRTLDVLHAATIQIEGGAVVAVDGTKQGVITLRTKADTRRALEVLRLAGLHASE